MVVDTLSEDEVDRIFQALADTTRRHILVRTSRRGESVSTLAGHYQMSFAAVQKHVAVLERSGLVTKRRQGRQHLVRGTVHALRDAVGLLEQYESVWRSRLDRFGDVLADDPIH
jgi:DNA-binding transcriptional ArsR family regulator